MKKIFLFGLLVYSMQINASDAGLSVPWSIAYRKYEQSSARGLDELKEFLNQKGITCKAIWLSFPLWDGSSSDNTLKWQEHEKPVVKDFGDSSVGIESHSLFPTPLKIKGNTLVDITSKSVEAKWQTEFMVTSTLSPNFVKTESFGLINDSPDKTLMAFVQSYVIQPGAEERWLGQQKIVLCSKTRRGK